MSQSRAHSGPPGERMAKDPRAFLQLAEEHRRNGRLKEAIAVCLEGLGRHPGLDAARITLGRAYLESGQPEIARGTLEEVFGRLPEHHLAGKLLAEAQQQLGDLAAAESTCRSLLRRYPRDREIEAILESVTRRETPAGVPAAGGAAAAGPPAPSPAARSAGAPPAADPEPEYMPEDVDLGATTGAAAPCVGALPPVMKSPAGAAPDPAPERASRPAPASGGDALQTSTLADLYMRQGLVDRAIEVYRAMLRVDPGNQRARQRLTEIESGGAPAAPATTVAPPSAAQADARRRVTARLEEWLDTVRRASTTAGRTGR